jgi:hypothetical protein
MQETAQSVIEHLECECRCDKNVSRTLEQLERIRENLMVCIRACNSLFILAPMSYELCRHEVPA